MKDKITSQRLYLIVYSFNNILPYNCFKNLKNSNIFFNTHLIQVFRLIKIYISHYKLCYLI